MAAEGSKRSIQAPIMQPRVVDKDMLMTTESDFFEGISEFHQSYNSYKMHISSSPFL